VAVAQGRPFTPQEGRKMSTLFQGFSWDLLLTWLPDLFAGFLISCQVTLMALLIGIPVGLVCALGVQSPSVPIRTSFLTFVEAGRGAPTIVLLQFLYFGLPRSGLTLSSWASAVLALAWTTAAYTSEIIRAGLDAVPAGQKEAIGSLGLSRWDGLRYVLLPQGLRVAVPALMGFAILLFQGTSLCFTIALPELISRAYGIGSSTFQYFPALVSAGLFYVAVCLPASFLVSLAEHRAEARISR
jgi:polar amino acid transport system permease protein